MDIYDLRPAPGGSRLNFCYMSDLEKFIDLYKSVDTNRFIDLYKSIGINLIPETDEWRPTCKVIKIDAYSNNHNGLVRGYDGFYTELVFDLKGKFLEQIIAE